MTITYNIFEIGFEEFLSFDNAVKIILIEGDIETYGREKFKKSIDSVDSLKPQQLNGLLNDLKTVDKKDKEALKKVYAAFIEKVCKGDKVVIIPKNEDEQNESYNSANEYKAVTTIAETDETNITATEYLDEKSNQLEELTQVASLSNIEIHALEYLKSKKIEKHPLLNNFTLNGIIQIANRGAYKLYYQRNSTRVKTLITEK